VIIPPPGELLYGAMQLAAAADGALDGAL